jgi:hypothetical protein
MKVWLDDCRSMPPSFDVHVKTASEAISLLKEGGVKYVSFDHDLGLENAGTGHDVAKWILEQAFYGKLSPIDWFVHSANPVGAENIKSVMKQAERFWRENENNNQT